MYVKSDLKIGNLPTLRQNKNKCKTHTGHALLGILFLLADQTDEFLPQKTPEHFYPAKFTKFFVRFTFRSETRSGIVSVARLPAFD